MVVHAGRDQEVAHAVHADKKGLCRLVLWVRMSHRKYSHEVWLHFFFPPKLQVLLPFLWNGLGLFLCSKHCYSKKSYRNLIPLIFLRFSHKPNKAWSGTPPFTRPSVWPPRCSPADGDISSARCKRLHGHTSFTLFYYSLQSQNSGVVTSASMLFYSLRP